MVALALAALLAAAPPAAGKITFGPARALLDACPGEIAFVGVGSGTLPGGTVVDLSSVSLDRKQTAAGDHLTLAGQGSIDGESINETTLSGVVEKGDDGMLAQLHAFLAAPHQLAKWLAGRTVRSGQRLQVPGSMLAGLGKGARGHVVVEKTSQGARLRFDVTGGQDGPAERIKGELVVDPATWWTKSARVDVRGAAASGHFRGFSVCRA